MELQLALQEAFQNATGGGQPSNGVNGQSSDTLPMVTLSVSNPSPQLYEEVVLRCSIVGVGGDRVTYDFQPPDGRLLVDRNAGTASFIVEASDIGASFAFTCTATNDSGTSEPSNRQVITPSS